jgi:hypothetical protein
LIELEEPNIIAALGGFTEAAMGAFLKELQQR